MPDTAIADARRGVSSEQLMRLKSEAEAAYVAARPKSAAVARGDSGFLGGVPMHWMRDWPMPFPMLVAKAKKATLVDIDGTAGIVGAAIDAAEALLAGSTGGQGNLALLAAVDDLLTEPTGRLRQLAIDVSSLRAELQDGDLANVRWLIGL
ncbi:MAG TPA: hypothetical protein PLJ34_06335, partial [Hyphomicrobiales bacterium]|nr:hypothetical protein [Hyphomicrobiales bacterium]